METPAGFDVTREDVVVGRLRLTVARPRSAEDLIDEDAYAVDERLPYWAELWPSAHVLAAELAARDLRGRRVVELGCGVGLPSVVAALGGADVLATDWYDEALRFVASHSTKDALVVAVRQGRTRRSTSVPEIDAPVARAIVTFFARGCGGFGPAAGCTVAGAAPPPRAGGGPPGAGKNTRDCSARGSVIREAIPARSRLVAW